MVRTLLLAVVSLSLIACARPEPQQVSAELEFVAAGEAVELSSDEEARVRTHVEQIVRSANYNSLHHPNLSSKIPGTEASQNAGALLWLEYREPVVFETLGGRLLADRVEISITHDDLDGGGHYPWPIRLQSGDKTVWLNRVGGTEILTLGLDPAVYPHLPESMRRTMDSGRPTLERYQAKLDGQ